MGLFSTILFALFALALLGGVVCFVLVVRRMFQRDYATLAIVCVVTTWCPGIGPLIAFLFGWLKAAEWQLKSVMLTWTGCLAAAGIFYGIFYLVAWLTGSSGG